MMNLKSFNKALIPGALSLIAAIVQSVLAGHVDLASVLTVAGGLATSGAVYVTPNKPTSPTQGETLMADLTALAANIDRLTASANAAAQRDAAKAQADQAQVDALVAAVAAVANQVDALASPMAVA